jgi:PAS domain-containing protein
MTPPQITQHLPPGISTGCLPCPSRRGGSGGRMTGPEIDFAQVFRDLPIPAVVLTPDFDIADMNLAYLQVAGRTREELLGRHVFDMFPDNPADPGARGVSNLTESLRRVLATGKPDTLAFQQYDVEVPGRPGVFARRYWCPVNAPIFGSDGRVVLIVQLVEEITERVRRFVDGLPESGSLGGHA